MNSSENNLELFECSIEAQKELFDQFTKKELRKDPKLMRASGINKKLLYTLFNDYESLSSFSKVLYCEKGLDEITNLPLEELCFLAYYYRQKDPDTGSITSAKYFHHILSEEVYELLHRSDITTCFARKVEGSPASLIENIRGFANSEVDENELRKLKIGGLLKL